MSTPGTSANELYQHKLGRMLATGEHSDLKIICGPYEWAVHKAVLCPQSEFFNLACKPGRFEEGYTNVINLKAVGSDEDSDENSCDYPECIKYMIGLCYGQDYALQEANEVWNGRSWLPKNHTYAEGFVRLFATAVKYQNPELQANATTKFGAEINTLFECKSITDDDENNIAIAIYMVYGEHMPQEVRVLKDIIITALWKNPTVRNSDGVTSTLTELHELCLDLVKANPVSQDLEERIPCDVCEQVALRYSVPAGLVTCVKCQGMHFECATCNPKHEQWGKELGGLVCRRCMNGWGPR